MIRAYENHWFPLIGPYSSMEKKVLYWIWFTCLGVNILIGPLPCSKQRVGIRREICAFCFSGTRWGQVSCCFSFLFDDWLSPWLASNLLGQCYIFTIGGGFKHFFWFHHVHPYLTEDEPILNSYFLIGLKPPARWKFPTFSIQIRLVICFP